MENEAVTEFIINGSYDGISIKGGRTTRMELITKFGKIEGINKKNGVFEVLKKDEAYYYLGKGAMGDLSGIMVCNLLPLKLSAQVIDNLLKTRSIGYERSDDGTTYTLHNNLKLFFNTHEATDEKYLTMALAAKDKEIEVKLLGVIEAR